MVSLRALVVQPRFLHFVFSAALVAAIWASYWPSLEHVPRADQWAYLIDTLHCETFGELWSMSYSYNRVRAVGPGDADLFRPVLFALLVVEKHCFGNNFVPSQVIGLGLHTAVILLLLAILRRIAACRPLSPPADRGVPSFRSMTLAPYAVTVFFALNFSTMELVVWAHLHGYLLFLVFVLGAMLLLSDSLYRPDLTPRRARGTLLGCWVCAVLSAFTYELGQFVGMLLGLVLLAAAWQQPRRTAKLAVAGCFLAILPLYQGVNRWDRTVHQGRFAEEYLPESIQEKALSSDTLEHAGRFVAFAAVQPFFPSVTGCWYQGERIHIQEPVFGWIKYVRPNVKLIISYGVAFVFFAFCMVGLRRFRRSDARRLWPMLFVPATLFALYAAITVLGRMNLRPSRYVLCSNSYYTYIALLFLVIGAFTLWQALDTTRSRRLNALSALLCAGLIFLGAYSSGRIRHVADRVRDRYADFHATVRQLEAFIAEHRHENDFRIAFDMRPEDPFPVTHSIPFPLTLTMRWIDNHEPKYVISFPQGRFTATPAAEWRRQHPGPRQLFPDLVRVGTDFNVWHWQGKYYGTLHWDDVFRPDLKEHAYVIEGDTIQAVLDEVPVRHEEFMEDLRTGWCIPPRTDAKTIDADYRGFEIVEAGAYYYAVPAGEAPFRVNRFNGRRYSTVFVADELELVQHYVDEHTVAGQATSASTTDRE